MGQWVEIWHLWYTWNVNKKNYDPQDLYFIKLYLYKKNEYLEIIVFAPQRYQFTIVYNFHQLLLEAIFTALSVEILLQNHNIIISVNWDSNFLAVVQGDNSLKILFLSLGPLIRDFLIFLQFLKTFSLNIIRLVFR